MVENPGVVVGMSGGVDSSVAAALLLQQGYQVTGVMIKVWKDHESQVVIPDLENAEQGAKQVADQLGISLLIIDAESAFKREVVQPFIAGYLNGITPSPCSICNRRLKGKVLLQIANEQGARYAATGHYARLEKSPVTGKIELLKGVDPNKDQSYMLALVTQEDLSRMIYPVGGMLKADIRKAASQLGLPVAKRKDSQDLCFLPDGNYRGFLKRNAGDVIRPGKIINTEGEVLGQHDGLPFYTIGQRKGIRLAAPRPLYVLGKNVSENQLVVGELDELGSRTLITSSVNWISGENPRKPFTAEVKVRYRSIPHRCVVEPLTDGSMRIDFEDMIRDITPGQVAVVYDKDKVLGGGIII